MELALARRVDFEHVALGDRHLFAVDDEIGLSAEHRVDLFLPVFGVVVLGVFGEPGREIEHLHTERLDAELGTGQLDGAVVDRLQLVDRLDGVAHAPSLGGGRWASWPPRPDRASASRPILARAPSHLVTAARSCAPARSRPVASPHPASPGSPRRGARRCAPRDATRQRSLDSSPRWRAAREPPARGGSARRDAPASIVEARASCARPELLAPERTTEWPRPRRVYGARPVLGERRHHHRAVRPAPPHRAPPARARLESLRASRRRARASRRPARLLAAPARGRGVPPTAPARRPNARTGRLPGTRARPPRARARSSGR